MLDCKEVSKKLNLMSAYQQTLQTDVERIEFYIACSKGRKEKDGERFSMLETMLIEDMEDVFKTLRAAGFID